MKNFETKKEPNFPKAISLMGWMVATIGLAAFIGWISGFRILSSFGRNYIPMAPGTAIGMITFGFYFLLGASKPNQIYRKWLFVALLGFCSIIGFLIFLKFFGVDFDVVEDYIFPSRELLGQFPTNHMSAYSGLLFFLSGVAIETKILFTKGKNTPDIVGVLGMSVAFAGFVAVLGYSFGSPFLYSGRFIPMALSTSIAFLLLGLGLIWMGGPSGFILKQFIGNYTSARVLRTILPVVLSAIIFEDLLDILITDHLHVNPALTLSILTITFSVLTTLVVVRLTKKIFQSAEKAEQDRLRAEEEILKFKLGIERSIDAVFVTDTEGIIRYANASFEKVYGYSQEEAVGKTPRILKSGTLSQDVYVSFWDTLLKKGIVSGEILNKTKDGHFITIDGTNNPILDAAGNLIGFLGIHRDITVRKQKELEIQVLLEIGSSVSTTSNLTELMEQMHNSLRKVIYAENCFFALYDENTGLFSFPYFVDQIDAVPPPLSMSKSCTAYVFQTRKSLIITPPVAQYLREQNEIELVGSPSPSWIGVPLQTSSKIIGVLVLQHYQEENVYNEDNLKFLDSITSQIANVIERRRAEEALTKSEADLRESNASKDKFFSIISHDLKSPFNSIVGFSDILAAQVRQKDFEGIEEYAEIIQNSSQRALDLLSNLLQWSRSQTGRISFNPENIEIVALTSEAIELLANTAKQKSITIFMELHSNDFVFADKDMISTVLRNLISNAVKFTHPCGKITISSEHREDELLVSVSDNGVGIKAEAIGKLFRTDESHSTQGTQNEQGTGLGLILCKEFIEKHRGEIWVESEVGKGSKFCFTIPKV